MMLFEQKRKKFYIQAWQCTLFQQRNVCENLAFDSVDGLNASGNHLQFKIVPGADNKCHGFSPFAHLPLQAGSGANGAGGGLPRTVQIICAPSLEREKRTQGCIKTGQTEEFTFMLHAGVRNQFSTISHTHTRTRAHFPLNITC